MNFKTSGARLSVAAGLSLAVALSAGPALAEELSSTTVAPETETQEVVAVEAEPVTTQASDEATPLTDQVGTATDLATSAQMATTATVVSETTNSSTVTATVSATQTAPVNVTDGTMTTVTDAQTDSASDVVTNTADVAQAAGIDAQATASVAETSATADASSGDATSTADTATTTTDTSKNGLVKEGDATYYYVDGVAQTGWQYVDDAWHYFDTAADDPDAVGQMETGEAYIYQDNDTIANPGTATRHWYWFGEDGVPHYQWQNVTTDSGINKWVYYDEGFAYMVYGEHYLYSGNDGDTEKISLGKHWYYFDEQDGTTKYGWRYVDSSGGKWVYYDGTPQTGGWGWMLHGEAYVRQDNNEGSASHWYYFDDATGGVTYGWKNLSDGRIVYYIPGWGYMAHGYYNVTDVDTYEIDTSTERIQAVDSSHDRSVTYYFDENTGNWTVGSAAAWSAYNRIKAAGSSSGYVICVDLTNHRTVIFQGNAGSWKPIFDWSCGTGVKSRPDLFPYGTPVGMYVLGSDDTKQYNGHNDPEGRHFEEGDHWWFTSIWYDVGFHSTLDNGVSEEDQLGRDVSMACVRLHYGNAKWLYKHCGVGTPVYIYT